jgi:hypothetical protein
VVRGNDEFGREEGIAIFRQANSPSIRAHLRTRQAKSCWIDRSSRFPYTNAGRWRKRRNVSERNGKPLPPGTTAPAGISRPGRKVPFSRRCARRRAAAGRYAALHLLVRAGICEVGDCGLAGEFRARCHISVHPHLPDGPLFSPGGFCRSPGLREPLQFFQAGVGTTQPAALRCMPVPGGLQEYQPLVGSRAGGQF